VICSYVEVDCALGSMHRVDVGSVAGITDSPAYFDREDGGRLHGVTWYEDWDRGSNSVHAVLQIRTLCLTDPPSKSCCWLI
jgi:hypothetical protein